MQFVLFYKPHGCKNEVEYKFYDSISSDNAIITARNIAKNANAESFSLQDASGLFIITNEAI